MKNLFFVFIICNYLSAQTTQIQLNKNWAFRSMDNPKEFLPAKVPGTVHTDLFENELIPHPFVGNNELELQWISDERWQYVLEFELTKKQLKSQNIDLVFEGLDTYASIYLNGEKIDFTNNAFRIWKYDVKKLLKKKNRLVLTFLPTQIYEEEAKSKIPYELPEGNRIFTRKAQFQYGWDWGPKYNTMGIWRPVYLEFWNDGKLNDMYMNQLYVNENMARMHFEINLISKRKQNLILDYFVNDEKINSLQLDVKNETYNITTPFNIDQPKRWWTHNLGDPYLYEFKVQLKDLKGNLMDEKIVKKGIRTIELVTEKDEFGESFYFKLNGEPVFMKGANYIPQSSFQSWVSEENYEKLLSDVVDSNMNMLRVWGGGIYEDNYFYELCDEKGILIWQDFMFACAMYPGDEAFLENVKQEAIENVKRLRNHSSIALWCGNNESSEGWHRWGWQDGRSEVEKAEIWGNYQKLFNRILPEIVKEYTGLPYWETSPKFGRGDARYLSEGDAHDWWIWHDGHPFENLEKKTPRFMSEFGFQAFPSLEVIKYINGGKSTSISSEEFKNHQKHSRGFDIIKTYMERDFPVPTNEEDYVYMSQLVQAYGIGNAIEAHRSSLNFPRTMGSLYWQLNDVWPAVSWSGIDAFGNWKALQYRVKEAFEPLQFFFREEENNKLGIYIVNDLKDDIYDKIKLEISDFEGNTLYSGSCSFSSLGNRDLITRIELDGLNDHKNEYFVKGTFRNLQNVYVPGKPKDWKLKDEPIEVFISEKNENGFSILLKSKTFQKSVCLSTEVQGKFADNFFDLLPNEPYVIEFKTDVKELKLEDLKIKSLNDFVN